MNAVRLGGWLALLAAGPVAAQSPQSQTFRAAADAVLVEVAVHRGRQPVTGLTVADFELRDNGVVQELESISDLPRDLDVVVLVDVSQSIRRNEHERIRLTLDALMKGVRASDRVTLHRLASGIRRVATVDELWAPLTVEEQHTALLDGLATVLMEAPQPGRRRIVIALTDVDDTNSVLPSNIVIALAERSETPIHLAAIHDPAVLDAWMYPNRTGERPWFNGYFAMMHRVTSASGGRFHDVTPDDDVHEALLDALDRMRVGYLLRYIPKGVASGGWHEVKVTVTRAGRYDVEHRSGYHAGGGDHRD